MMKRTFRTGAAVALAIALTGLTGCGEQTSDKSTETAQQSDTASKDESSERAAAQPETSATPESTATTETAAAPLPNGITKLWQLDGLAAPESALLDKARNAIYVSNVNGNGTDKDGNGFISKLSPDGKAENLKWVTGLNGPKGLAQVGDKLYVADIDQLVVIDVTTGQITARHDAAGAKFLNDVAADAQGRVYVSDMMADSIWRLDGSTFEAWLQSPELLNPNGLLVEGDNLIVAAWGVMVDGFATKVPGHLLKVSLADKSIAALGDGSPVGNLDGLEPDGAGAYIVTDWLAGKLLRIDAKGKADVLLPLQQGSADIGLADNAKTVIIPMMNNNSVVAYRLP